MKQHIQKSIKQEIEEGCGEGNWCGRGKNKVLCSTCQAQLKLLDKIEKVINKTKKCPNCNCGNPQVCCIDYIEIKQKLFGGANEK